MSSRFFLVGLVISSIGAAAWAQIKPEAPVGSRIKRDPYQASVDQARETMAGYGRCVASRAYRKAVEYVLDASTLTFNRKRYAGLTSPDCLMYGAPLNADAISLKLPGDMLRFTLADALVARDFAAFDSASIKTAPALSFPSPDPADYLPKPGRKYSDEELAELAEIKALAEGRIAFWRYGDCVVRTDPQLAGALLRSEPSSSQETAAFKAIMPALSSCLQKGDQFKSNRTMLRGTIALAFYRLASAIQPTPQGRDRP